MLPSHTAVMAGNGGHAGRHLRKSMESVTRQTGGPARGAPRSGHHLYRPERPFFPVGNWGDELKHGGLYLPQSRRCELDHNMFSASFLARKQIIIYLDRASEGMQKHDLEDLVVEALKALGGSGMIVDVAREIWIHHEAELRSSGDLFFTWQYDIRWAKKRLRDRNLVQVARSGQKSVWTLI